MTSFFTPRAALAALLLGIAAGDACAAGSQAGICRDTMADVDAGLELIQVGKSGKVAGGKEGAEALSIQFQEHKGSRAEKSKQIPGLDIDSITSSVSDAVAAVPGLDSVTGALAESAARELVSTLQDTLGSISKTADNLTNSAEGYRAAALEKVQDAKLTSQEKAAALEQAVNSTVEQYLPQWVEITKSVNATATVVVTSLNMAGASDVADTVSSALSEAMEQAATITDELSSASDIVANISEMAEEEVAVQLSKLNQTLEAGLKEAAEYRSSLDTSFAGMLDTAANALAKVVPGANATSLRAELAPLATSEAEISRKLVASADTLLNGIGAAGVYTEAAMKKSGSSRTSSAIALGVAALAAGLAL